MYQYRIYGNDSTSQPQLASCHCIHYIYEEETFFAVKPGWAEVGMLFWIEQVVSKS